MNIRSIDRPLYTRLLLAGIFVVGLVLRFYCLDCRNLWYDEVASIEVAQRGLAAIFTDRFGWMNVQTPLHYLIVWLTIQPVDPAATSLLARLPSALAGSISPLIMYAIGRDVFGRSQGLLAAAILAFSTIHLAYSGDVRPYAVLILLTLIAIYCLVQAERTGSPKWWIPFTISMVLNIFNSYYILTMMLPALGVYLLWRLWRLWQTTGTNRKPLLYAVASSVMMAVAALVMFSDLMKVPRTPPDFSRIRLSSLVNLLPEFAVWFTPFGVDTQPQRLLALAFFLVALAGFYAAWRRGGTTRHIAVLLGLFMVLPPAVLAVLSTSNTVFQKYAMSSMPLYFLLIANGLVALGTLFGTKRITAQQRLAFSTLLGLAAVALFAYSGYRYLTAGKEQPVIIRPDFRSMAAYLNEHARPEDNIIFAVWGDVVTDFYWRGKRPAPAYVALDPRLFDRPQQPKGGSIYWVVGYLDYAPTQLLTSKRWSDVKLFDRIYLLKEDNPPADVTISMERLVEEMEETKPPDEYIYRATSTMRGTIYQARGEAVKAAEAYKRSGSYFLIGDEYLRTSKGFAARGETEKAWRDALISKSMQPENPLLHRWLAEMLAASGRSAMTATQSQIAEALP